MFDHSRDCEAQILRAFAFLARNKKLTEGAYLLLKEASYIFSCRDDRINVQACQKDLDQLKAEYEDEVARKKDEAKKAKGGKGKDAKAAPPAPDKKKGKEEEKKPKKAGKMSKKKLLELEKAERVAAQTEVCRLLHS